ncbi:MAG: YbaK/EbsC family protein [Oscillospiraceae bacterium]|nr:YbaK/EbsC family protein [Oscillospiraceae bacterium]
MSIERARAWLTDRGVDPVRILEFPVSSATVELAAKALNCAPERIAKSLALRLLGAAGNGVLLVVAAGDARLDTAKYKARVGCKPKMLGHEEAAVEIGYAVGGVCPFGVNAGVEVWLDGSLRRFETVFPAVGSSNSAIELTLPELETLSCAKGWVDVCRLPEASA